MPSLGLYHTSAILSLLSCSLVTKYRVLGVVQRLLNPMSHYDNVPWLYKHVVTAVWLFRIMIAVSFPSTFRSGFRMLLLQILSVRPKP